MKSRCVAGAIALSLMAISSAALADNPNDAAMRNAHARAHDRAGVRKLNEAEQKRVRERDARLAKQWREWRAAQQAQGR